MKRIAIKIVIAVFLILAVSGCGKSPEKEILGKWYNDEGYCLEVLSDHTYSVDHIKIGYEDGINKGQWEYLEDEGFFKFYANTYHTNIIRVEINKDNKGKNIEYTYYGTFYKG